VYVFVPSDRIVAQSLNNPGSWHDSLVALHGNIYNKLESIFEACGGKCIVDSAFNQKRCAYSIKSGKRKPGETAERRRICHQATVMHQAMEWGMRAIQGSFPCLKDRFLFSDDRQD
jgi:hypothetical protein